LDEGAQPVTDDGVISRVQGVVVPSIAVAAVLVPLPPSGGDPSGPQPASPPAVRCDRTLSPHWRTTIARALRSRKRVRTICLHGGVYRTGEIWLRRRGVTITSVPGEHAIWRGRIVVRARNVTLERLSLDGTGRGRSSLPSPTINGAGFTLRDSDVTNRNGICVHPLTYRRVMPKAFTIERNRIHNCGRRPRTNQDHGVYVAGGNGVVRWNAIFDNADRGVQLFPAARGVRVYGNTIDGNGEGVNFGDAAAHNVVRDNLITNSRKRWNVEFFDLRGRGNRVLTNCVQATARIAYYRRRGGIAPDIERYLRLEGNSKADVQYADRAHGDLRPTSVSPACAGMGAPDEVTAGP
jgi:parallel beta helix pectate lyase-like protein